MTPEKFFMEPGVLAQKQYEALRLFFIEKKPAREVAMQFGYTYRGFTTLVSDFRGKWNRPGYKTVTISRDKKHQ